MAPEIIAAKGYTFSADLWSIGVCAYEFMYGGVPYAEDADVIIHCPTNRILMRYTKRLCTLN